MSQGAAILTCLYNSSLYLPSKGPFMMFKSIFLFILALSLVACQATNPPKAHTSAQHAKTPKTSAKATNPQPEAGANNAAATQIVPNLTGPQKNSLGICPGQCNLSQRMG
jgi:hypothetical protein